MISSLPAVVDITSIARDGSRAATADIPMGSNKLTGLADGTADQDAVTVSQLSVATNGSQMNSIQTTDGTPVTIITFVAGVDFMDDEAIVVRAVCSAMKSDGTQSIGQEVVATFRKDGVATTVQVQASTDIFRHSDDAQWDANFVLSGSDILLQVEGNTGDIVPWTCSSTILRRSGTL